MWMNASEQVDGRAITATPTPAASTWSEDMCASACQGTRAVINLTVLRYTNIKIKCISCLSDYIHICMYVYILVKHLI